MDHRLFAVLAIICFALGGAGCASQSQIESREQIMMPLQTGSAFQRRVMVQKEGPTKKPKKKKKEKDEKQDKKEKESKRTSPTPTPVPEVTEEEPPAAPDRFR
jgi:hypothetical protein